MAAVDAALCFKYKYISNMDESKGRRYDSARYRCFRYKYSSSMSESEEQRRSSNRHPVINIAAV